MSWSQCFTRTSTSCSVTIKEGLELDMPVIGLVDPAVAQLLVDLVVGVERPDLHGLAHPAVRIVP